MFISEEPKKISVHINEGHPGLLETLQINNNKQLLPLLTEQAMSKDFFSVFSFFYIYYFLLFYRTYKSNK
jgi:hypothetical protein